MEYFPPTSYRLRQWSALFRTGGTFGLYGTQGKKACQILNVSSYWGDLLLNGAIKGLFCARGNSNDFPNIIDLMALQRIVNFEGIESQFSILCYLPFLFLLRLPSGCICTKRALLGQDLEPELILKLRKRKNARSGEVLIRPCLCSGSILNDRGFCPVHRFWPVIKRSVRPGADISPRYR